MIPAESPAFPAARPPGDTRRPGHAPRFLPHGRPEEQGARRGSRADREAVRQGLDHEDGRRPDPERPAGRLDRLARARHRARRRRAAARPRRRDLRTRVVGQDDVVAAGRGAGAEGRRHGRLHRRGERARSGLRRQARRQRGRAPDLAAGHGRAGARDRRHARALGRRRHHRDRFGRGARAEGRDRGRDGRPAAGPAGAPDEPGAAQADGEHQARQRARDLHQPDPDEDRRDVRQSRRRRRAATRSSSTRRCASTSGGSARSRRARK